MKSLRVNLFVCVLLILGACQSNNYEELILGKWNVVFDVKNLVDNLSKEEKEIYDRLNEGEKREALNELQEMANKNIFEFREDQTFEFTTFVNNEEPGEVRQKGTWEIKSENNQNKLILSKKASDESDQVQREELLIQELSENRLLLVVEKKDQKKEEILLVPVENQEK